MLVPLIHSYHSLFQGLPLSLSLFRLKTKDQDIRFEIFGLHLLLVGTSNFSYHYLLNIRESVHLEREDLKTWEFLRINLTLLLQLFL